MDVSDRPLERGEPSDERRIGVGRVPAAIHEHDPIIALDDIGVDAAERVV